MEGAEWKLKRLETLRQTFPSFCQTKHPSSQLSHSCDRAPSQHPSSECVHVAASKWFEGISLLSLPSKLRYPGPTITTEVNLIDRQHRHHHPHLSPTTGLHVCPAKRGRRAGQSSAVWTVLVDSVTDVRLRRPFDLPGSPPSSLNYYPFNRHNFVYCLVLSSTYHIAVALII